MTLLVYRHDGKVGGGSAELRHLQVDWSPSPTRWIPPDKSTKYLFYSIFHYARIFRNQDYCWMALTEADVEVPALKVSMLCVPAHFRWPFMAKNDIQFIYVFARPGERGKGWGVKLLDAGLRSLAIPGRTFWYVTDEDNIPSQKLALRAGFGLAGKAVGRSGIFKRLQLSSKSNRLLL